jgi:hypothetical protein
MRESFLQGARALSFAASIVAAMLVPTGSADAWGGPGVWGWDPQEAYLNEYGFFDRYGPSRGDIQRMYRDNRRAMWGYPVYRGDIGPYGPTWSDVRRQRQRMLRRSLGYWY